jgi:putative membrane protein
MRNVANILVGLVALLHIGFLVLEMFLWQTPVGLKVFNLSPEAASYSAIIAKNQGLYNGFLAAGLIWSFFISNRDFQKSIRIFFLICIMVAGVYGALTAKFSILFIQALPAFCAWIALLRTSPPSH